MRIENYNITDTIDKAKTLLDSEKGTPPALKAMFEVLLIIIGLLVARLSLNSRNSSTPPSTDFNRNKDSKNKKTNQKPGGQVGHTSYSDSYRMEYG